MLKLPNSIEPSVMAENIVHLRDGLAAVDAKTLPATTSATTGQILKLTGETKTPAWADEYSYTPPAYSETETATGQKWIDGKDIYCRVFSSNTPETASAGTYNLVDLEENTVISCYGFVTLSDVKVFFNTATGAGNIFLQHKSTGEIAFTTNSASSFSNKPFVLVVYYTKPDPTPGRAPEDSDQEPEQELEEKKTTKKKTTK